jgi:imidazolonepropionase
MTSDSFVLGDIGFLVTNDETLGAGRLGILRDSAVVVERGRIAWVGPNNRVPEGASAEYFSARGQTVIPGFVDSHAHLVFAGDRSEEFAARMAGSSYTAGGIRTTVAATRAATTDELGNQVRTLVDEANQSGTTTIESKSGYGLTVDDERRSLQAAQVHADSTTFLGAHVVPAEYASDPDAYIDLICGPMLDACAPHAEWIDVFIDRGAFDADQATHILRAGIARGLKPRVHANQLGFGDGVRVAVEVGAASADHVTHTTDADIELLAGSRTVATLLPGAEFSTRSPYPDARRLIDAGVTVAIASDCNPGTSFTTSLSFCIAVAVRDMHMTPDEALWSATAGGALALQRTDVGNLSVGSSADLVSLNAPSHLHLAYRPGVDLVANVWKHGSRLR